MPDIAHSPLSVYVGPADADAPSSFIFRERRDRNAMNAFRSLLESSQVLPHRRGRHRAAAGTPGWSEVAALYWLYLGLADGMSIARVWTCRHSK